jgi:type IV pilus assembly protein PilM
MKAARHSSKRPDLSSILCFLSSGGNLQAKVATADDFTGHQTDPRVSPKRRKQASPVKEPSMLHAPRTQIEPIGLDLGLDSIKMLQLQVRQTPLTVDGQPGNPTLAVVAAAKHPLPEAARKNPAKRAQLAAETIRRMFAQQPFVGRNVIAALPREIVHVKNMRLNLVPEHELEAAVRLEAKMVFPFDLSQATMQFLPAGQVRQGSETRQEVIVLAALNTDVDDYLEQLNKIGVTVNSLDTEITGLFRSFERFIRREHDCQTVQMLVDIGARQTQVIIAKGRDISFYKPVNIGGLHLLDAVSRKLGITIDEAKALRERLLESGDDRRDPVRQAVFDATRNVAEELGREMAMCLRYYSVTFRGRGPARLRIVGGEASDPQLHAIFKSILSIPVESAQPLFSVDTSKMRSIDRTGRMSQWALAMGLCLRNVPHYFAPLDGLPRVPLFGESEMGTSNVEAPARDVELRTLNVALPTLNEEAPAPVVQSSTFESQPSELPQTTQEEVHA